MAKEKKAGEIYKSVGAKPRPKGVVAPKPADPKSFRGKKK